MLVGISFSCYTWRHLYSYKDTLSPYDKNPGKRHLSDWNQNSALHESEAMFRALAEMAPSAVFIFQGTRLKFVNPAAERLTGYSKQELLKSNFYDLFPAGRKKYMREWGMQVQRGEIPSSAR